MRHFNFLRNTPAEKDLFYRIPERFNQYTDKKLLSYSLGATLYMPATRSDLLNDLKKAYQNDTTSVILCLEDSIPDEKVKEAEHNLYELLRKLVAIGNSDLPLLFVRVRSPEHFEHIIEQNGILLSSLTGFVFPKFDDLSRGQAFVDVLQCYNRTATTSLYYMPVIESPRIIHQDTRHYTLSHVQRILDHSMDSLLAVRIGATDMSSAYGLRRSREFTVYDVHVVASAISDIVNMLGRAEDNRVITGAVWEHFAPSERTFKPLLRESIFAHDKTLRAKLVTEGNDTFIREVQLDKLNGITGKTVIHPSHVGIVHSLMVVSHEEYVDAMDILSRDDNGGVMASTYGNKMNEVKPHTAWARNIQFRARMFGVSREHVGFADFLEQYMV